MGTNEWKNKTRQSEKFNLKCVESNIHALVSVICLQQSLDLTHTRRSNLTIKIKLLTLAIFHFQSKHVWCQNNNQKWEWAHKQQQRNRRKRRSRIKFGRNKKKRGGNAIN